ncbi:MAG: glutamate synthase [Elusimicrobia bacterium CG1_02_63_36]|nr:MAG: glutamate synthase [Elusimicrobia bacterium CG1_02_63_36]PIP82898.1 MAG: glutamate synthase [Elusimicrobia bacterium CG22_combo_CG10-13_8_21_14_all_63_91]PJA15914.1 MAG: glutamate synthase [Elusimicrobia bacterium CG_4_10_14_0_2_um_filter_63_34]PJB25004.1 MAG: glutamate synthase [Elusimicrobia bacterium CG_4_9_14_3_um_filter_62_55]
MSDDLIPRPFSKLLTRMLREIESHDAIFDLPSRSFLRDAKGKDLSVRFHGKKASTPLGPAAGPHSQLAQNIVLAWLGGSRIIELKTVQILDELEIPRPCIDMRNVGFNVEWSQELRLKQSIEEYAKASMLIEILRTSGKLPMADGLESVIYDMSVGYDLKGIKSAPVQAFLDGMRDASELIERFRSEIPTEFKRFRDLDFQAKLSDTLTLSTFHGCPPEEIERIVDYLLREKKISSIIKLNPTLLGPGALRALMNDSLGYKHYYTPDSAFENDATWDVAVGFCERLSKTAAAEGLGFGVKFNNTLIVENREGFLPKSEKVMYLSGRPLHVIAMNLVKRFRGVFEDRIPISFSAGIDRSNFPDAVSLGLAPVTVCSDLLKPGGYGRARGYFDDLLKRMEACGASDIPDFILAAHGHADAALAKASLAEKPGKGTPEYARWVSAAKLLNTESYASGLASDPRYAQAKNADLPKRMDSKLSLFDCVTCDKCVPVCPNDANFTYPLSAGEVPVVKLHPENGGFRREDGPALIITKKHQLANFADFCNDCGNCDPFCPEEGGPYKVKPRFFGSLERFEAAKGRDGLFLQKDGDRWQVHGRVDGKVYAYDAGGGKVSYAGDGFLVKFDATDPAGTAEGEASGEVDLTFYFLFERIRAAIFSDEAANYIKY